MVSDDEGILLWIFEERKLQEKAGVSTWKFWINAIYNLQILKYFLFFFRLLHFLFSLKLWFFFS